MATLTETAYYARKMVMYGAVGILSLVLLHISWGMFSRWWLVLYPPPPPPPTVSFGVLPEIQFPEGISRENLTYRLETVSGATPDLGTQGKIYFMPAYRANVLGLELAKTLAKKLGFLSDPTQQDELMVVWSREGTLPGVLTVNVVTGHFSFDTAWYRDSELVSLRAPSQEEAVRSAQEYLRSVGLLSDDVASGKTRVEFLQSGAGAFSQVLSQSEANFTKVHFFRNNVNNLSVVTPQEDQGLIQVIVSGNKSGDKRIINVIYQYSPVEMNMFATYPLRGAQTAWGQFQLGEGVVVKLSANVHSIVVRDITIGYYDASSPQEFLQPVYIFKGDNGFVGYISAVDPKWVEKR